MKCRGDFCLTSIENPKLNAFLTFNNPRTNKNPNYGGSMTEIIFSKDALSFYEDLRSKHYSREKYNSSNSIFHDEIKPKMLDLLTQLADMLAFEISELTFDASDDLGSPWVHGHAAKYAWGAITRLGKTKHSDLQFYVALRFDYIRFGLYVSEKHATSVFGEVYRAIYADETRFLSMLNALEKDGIFLTRNISNDETGSPQKLKFNPKYVASAIGQDTTFNVMTAIPLEEISETDVFPQIADVFRRLIPMYRFVLGMEN